MRRYKGFYRGQGRRGYLLAVNRLQGCCAQEARRLYKACRWLITKLIARSVAPLKLSVSARSSSHRFSEIFIARSGETLAAVAIVFIGFQIIFALSPVVYTILTNCSPCSTPENQLFTCQRGPRGQFSSSNDSRCRSSIWPMSAPTLTMPPRHAWNAGFISSVVRGGPTPPPPHVLLGHPSVNDESQGVEPITQSNVASRRLWLGLKYWQSEPVLSKMTLVSKPKRRINLDVPGLRQIIRGEKSGYVEGLRSPGECLFLSTDRGILEARECVEKKVGGLVLCRVL
ncbi:hypothetical protein DTO027B5_4074 [Paecilomyces variotii]|nr:hypothetical protein DTO169C6_3399 [Paecilomyces variotii]KAJ9242091.1 hypothetical protein DTO169E5_3312 [Paecilomyces variotii]KAJ9284909.1 hypothetical protein DTO021C3_7542 [Paecilomyces variotii]KAJ9323322.1 hypothetical protein DTO027B3_5672 [Paecilomyces variotii]KAJ9334166.1 hypothetical protein DTO027B5_4074 [Paecilomyces variotii]